MTTEKKEKTEESSDQRRVNPALGFGTVFAGGMAFFGLGGHWLDEKFDKEPLFTLLGIGLAFVFGGWELWKLVALSNREIAEDKRDKTEGNHTDEPAR